MPTQQPQEEIISDLKGDGAVYQTLLESTKAIPWQIDWATMTFTYIGPQIEVLLGWSQESWVSANDWAERIHPEDRERVVNFCIAQSQDGIDHEADYRAVTKNKGHIWIRDVVHVIRNDAGETVSLVGFMFDITERKKTEEKLIAMQTELERLSFIDHLTGIANRRKFNVALETEWQTALTNQQTLSAIIIDIDHFKEYNDAYGHIKGDDCLQRVAQTLHLALVKPRDLVARFGGEEFILLLPESNEAAALKVAQRCQSLIEALDIPHIGSTTADHLTVSMGVGSIMPNGGVSSETFLRSVDDLLYQAKRRGRNRIEAKLFA